MKAGTLVRLRDGIGIHSIHIEHHGIGVVIGKGNSDGYPDSILVSFPKLGSKQWRAINLLEVIE